MAIATKEDIIKQLKQSINNMNVIRESADVISKGLVDGGEDVIRSTTTTTSTDQLTGVK